MKIFLIGMMGAGKSFWSKILAEKLNYQAFDLDAVIEEKEKMTIAEIFATKGETYFRQAEEHILKSFSDNDNFILATGGGTPCFHDNINWMNTTGITIWIDESIDVLVQRLLPERAHRPLLSRLSDQELHEFLADKMRERHKFYALSQHRLGPNIEVKDFDFLQSSTNIK